MVIGLIWILGVYGLSALLVHGVYRFQQIRTIHVAIVTMNNQTQIEWYLRSFLWISALRRRSIYVTVFDAGSTDETKAIVAKLAATRDNIKLEISAEGLSGYIAQHGKEAVVILHLMNRTPNDSWLIPKW